MYRKIVGAMYILNILFQSLFNLASPILLLLGLAWLLVTKCSAPPWLYAVLGVVGALCGFVSMIRFIISACESLERLERQREKNDRLKNGKANSAKSQ